MFEAKLSDPIHGTTTAQAPTAEEAVEKAFREMAESWMHPNDKAAWPADSSMFDGWLEPLSDDVWEVWWNNRADSLLGTVRKVS